MAGILGITIGLSLTGLSYCLVFKVLLPKRAAQNKRAIADMCPIMYTRGVNLFGRKSSGNAQIRGNGALALLPDELVFCMFYPRREYRVPLQRTPRIEHPTSFLRKRVFRELLVIY